MDGHIFVRNPYDKRICDACRRGPGDPIHLYTIPGVDLAEDIARHAEELAARMHEPLADISDKSGRMERETPLFFGTGDNPGLF